MGRELGERTYVMGHKQDEIERLVEQSNQFRVQSELLLRAAGLSPGMRAHGPAKAPGLPPDELSLLRAVALTLAGATALSLYALLVSITPRTMNRDEIMAFVAVAFFFSALLIWLAPRPTRTVAMGAAH